MLFLFFIYSGSWKIFTGNEIGLILGWWSLLKHKEQHPEMYPGNFICQLELISCLYIRLLALTLVMVSWPSNVKNVLF